MKKTITEIIAELEKKYQVKISTLAPKGEFYPLEILGKKKFMTWKVNREIFSYPQFFKMHFEDIMKKENLST